MNGIYGIIAALVISGSAQANAEQDSPPFASLACSSGNASVQIAIQHTGESDVTGPVTLQSGDFQWQGTWNWHQALESTRLAGYHVLNIDGYAQSSQQSLHLSALYSLQGKLTGGWLEMPGFSGVAECHIISQEQACKVPPQNDCSHGPRRLCCYCDNNGLTCN